MSARGRPEPRLPDPRPHPEGPSQPPEGAPAPAAAAAVGLWLGVAFAGALLALLGFAAIAAQLPREGLTEIDVRIMEWLDARSTPFLDRWVRSVTELGSALVMVVMALLVSVFLWIHGERRAIPLLWIGLAGTLVLDTVLKELFARERPSVFEWRTDLPRGHGFPSGHALNATVGYTLFAWLVARLERSRRLRAGTFAVAALLIGAIAFSRVYLGVHYPSDVLAGVLVGFAWAMACVFAVYVLRDLRPRR